MRRPLRAKKKGELILAPVRANAGIEADYRRRLLRLIDEMHRSVVHFVGRAYAGNQPEIAQDASPANILRGVIRRLTRRWQRNFDTAAQKLASYFAQSVSQRSDAALKSILKKGGFSIDWTMTAAQNDIVQATVATNVGLIKSIPQQYLGNVERIVMEGVQRGGDLGQITDALQAQHGVTRRRAAFIARDQGSKSTAALNRARMIELGVTEAVWVHSGGGKTQRRSHVKAGKDKQRYDVSKGWFDPDEGKNILPGELISCRCVGRAVIPGFT